MSAHFIAASIGSARESGTESIALDDVVMNHQQQLALIQDLSSTQLFNNYYDIMSCIK